MIKHHEGSRQEYLAPECEAVILRSEGVMCQSLPGFGIDDLEDGYDL